MSFEIPEINISWTDATVSERILSVEIDERNSSLDKDLSYLFEMDLTLRPETEQTEALELNYYLTKRHLDNVQMEAAPEKVGIVHNEKTTNMPVPDIEQKNKTNTNHHRSIRSDTDAPGDYLNGLDLALPKTPTHLSTRSDFSSLDSGFAAAEQTQYMPHDIHKDAEREQSMHGREFESQMLHDLDWNLWPLAEVPEEGGENNCSAQCTSRHTTANVEEEPFEGYSQCLGHKSSRKKSTVAPSEPPLQARICTACMELFPNPEKMWAHRAEAHPDTSPYNCIHCGFESRYNSELAKHIMRFHPQGYLEKCRNCRDRFQSSTATSSHYHKEHTLKQPFQCESCKMRFKTAAFLETHHKNEKHGPFAVVLESRIEPGRDAQVGPSAPVPEREISCLYCHGYTFEKPELLWRHLADKHPRCKPFHCYRCGYTNKDLNFVHMHVRKMHLDAQFFHCPGCILSFQTEAGLRTHFPFAHRARECFTCRDCKIPFEHITWLKMHEKRWKHGEFAQRE